MCRRTQAQTQATPEPVATSAPSTSATPAVTPEPTAVATPDQATEATAAPESEADVEHGGSTDREHSDEEGSTEHYDGPNVEWSDQDETTVKETATAAMALFARPEVPDTQWFADLEPMLAATYAEDAKYIDPARVSITAITDGPSISREAGNPMTVTASFYTNDGPWDMLLHRSAQDAPWLVESISPKTSQ